MRTAFTLCLSAALVPGMASGGDAPEEKARGYASKPLGAWVDTLKRCKDTRLQDEAREALGPGGPYAKVAVPALLDALAQPESEDLRRFGEAFVKQTLADYGPPVVPSLVRALKSPETRLRVAAADALGYVRPNSAEVFSALTEAMKDPAPEVRVAAARNLGQIGRRAHVVVPALTAAMGDRNHGVCYTAATALGQFGPRARPATPALIMALKDNNAWVNRSAAEALGRIGPDAKEAVPELVEAFRSKKESSERREVAMALGEIGSAAKQAIPALVEAMRDQDKELREYSAHALGQIGPAAGAAVPALRAVARDRTNEGYAVAIVALGKIGPSAKSAVPIMLEALTAPECRGYRGPIARALGGIGPEARAAVPALTAIVQDPFTDTYVRQAAAEAVARIDPELAARKGFDTAYLNVRLGKVASIRLAPRAISDERAKDVKKLIAALAKVTAANRWACTARFERSFYPMDSRFNPSPALRSLVEMGPDALPFLLDALEDTTPTKLEYGPSDVMYFGNRLEGNPLNPSERRGLSGELTRGDDEYADPNQFYTLKVGDICFVAIGQIVGRPYHAAHLGLGLGAGPMINSPVERKALRERVRALWRSKDPAQKLIDSLLLDYATEGVFNGSSLDGWDEGSERQIDAVMRLLYYFPRETAPLIADRLRALDVQRVDGSDWIDREVKNRVRTVEFIKTVAWCTARPIREALAEIAKRTDDPEIKEALKGRPDSR